MEGLDEGDLQNHLWIYLFIFWNLLFTHLMTFRYKRPKHHLSSEPFNCIQELHIYEKLLVLAASGCIIHSYMCQKDEQQVGCHGEFPLEYWYLLWRESRTLDGMDRCAVQISILASGSSWDWFPITCHCPLVFPNLDSRLGLSFWGGGGGPTRWSWPQCLSPHVYWWSRILLPVLMQLIRVLMAKVSVLGFVLQGREGRVPWGTTSCCTLLYLAKKGRMAWGECGKRRVSNHQLVIDSILRLFPLFIVIIAVWLFCILTVPFFRGTRDRASFLKTPLCFDSRDHLLVSLSLWGADLQRYRLSNRKETLIKIPSFFVLENNFSITLCPSGHH